MCKSTRKKLTISYHLQKHLSRGAAKEAIQTVWLQLNCLEANGVGSYILIEKVDW